MDFFMQLLGMIMNGQNPVQILMSILNQNMSKGNPMYQNLANMTQKQDAQALETFARNLAQSKGIDYDQAFTKFKQELGIR